MTTFGLGVRDGGPLGIRPVADGWAVKATEAGEIAAVHRMCAALPRKASVVMVDGRVRGRFTEVVRGMCGYPAAGLPDASAGPRAPGRARHRGGGPAPGAPGREPRAPGPLRDPIQHIMQLHTTQEEATMMHPPEAVNPLDFEVWMLEAAR